MNEAFQNGVLFGLGIAQGNVAKALDGCSKMECRAILRLLRDELSAEASRHIHKQPTPLENEVTPHD